MDTPTVEINVPTVEAEIVTATLTTGTDDYSQLTNKPKINNVELNGNKTTSDLGITIPTKTSELTNDSGFLTEHQSLAAYSTTTEMNTAISNHHDSTKQNTLTAGTNITIVNDVISATGSGEPSAYIKDASVSNKTLTLTKKDDSTVTFTDTGSVVSASATGTATTEAGYITVDGTEWKLPSGGGTVPSGIANGTGTNSLLLGNTNSTYKIASGSYSIIAGTYDRDYVAKIQATGNSSAIFGYFASNGTTNPTAYTAGSGSFINGAVVGYTALSKAMDAEGRGSHVEGFCDKSSGMRAYGDGSHVEGYCTCEYGMYISTASKGAHIEGYCDAYSGMEATGIGSHAEGYNTKANSNYQHVSGKFNVADSANTYALIIGNGTANNARSNALTVDWSGNLVCNNIPAPPSTDGDYVLKCSIVSGVATYSWTTA